MFRPIPSFLLGVVFWMWTTEQEVSMNWDQIEGKWKQAAGKIKEKFGKLTDDDLQVIRGKRDQLVGKIQERYGIAKDEAERQVDEFSRTYDTDDTTTREKIRSAGH
jgi:uncharacterized protein YjbJ (UPF0337 family)